LWIECVDVSLYGYSNVSASKNPIRIAFCSPHIAARASAGRWTVGAEKISYHYNGGSDRVHKLRDLTREEVLHDESGKRLHSFVQSTSGFGTNAFREYVYLDNVPVTTVDSAGIAYLETDHLGTPRVAADPATNAWRWRWNFFGTTFGEHAPTLPASGTLALDLRYQGQAYDAETGLHYNYFRDYEPGTGRYVESDPIGLLGGITTYGYAIARPLANVDPSGLYCITTYDCYCMRNPARMSAPHAYYRSQS
jgi:RHS repeat-associated protein